MSTGLRIPRLRCKGVEFAFFLAQQRIWSSRSWSCTKSHASFISLFLVYSNSYCTQICPSLLMSTLPFFLQCKTVFEFVWIPCLLLVQKASQGQMARCLQNWRRTNCWISTPKCPSQPQANRPTKCKRQKLPPEMLQGNFKASRLYSVGILAVSEFWCRILEPFRTSWMLKNRYTI